MKRDDNILKIIMIAMQELKQVIPSASIAVFVIDPNFAQGLEDIEEASGGSIYHQRFMLENGRMTEAVNNEPGEIKTSFNNPEDVKYGIKET